MFAIPPLLTSVSALPGETSTPEMARREIIFAQGNLLLHTSLLSTKILKLADECQRYSKPKLCRFRGTEYCMIEKTIYGVHVNVSPGSAETLVRRGEITNHHLIAYSLSNISAKNYQTRLMSVEVIVCNTSVVFWDTVYILCR